MAVVTWEKLGAEFREIPIWASPCPQNWGQSMVLRFWNSEGLTQAES